MLYQVYANGDSWTSGWPDEETYGHREFSWPHLLSLKLNQPVLNDARAKSSNSRIYRRTFDYLVLHKPKIALVFLTRWERLEYGNNKTGKMHQYLPQFNASYFKKDWHPYLSYSNMLRNIISLQNTALQTNTSLYFLDTHTNNFEHNLTLEWFKGILKRNGTFDAMDDERILKKFQRVQELANSINYDNFISRQSFKELVTVIDPDKSNGHPTLNEHQKMAEIVYNFLNSKGFE
jgi:hypothetical protein